MMKKIIILSALFICLGFGFPFVSHAANLLFSDGFESGNFSNWNSTFTAATITTSEKKSGSYSAQVNYYPNKLQGLIKNLSSPPNSEFYFTYSFKIAPTFHAPYLGFKWARLKHGNVDGIQTEFYLNSVTWNSSGHSYQTGTSGLGVPGGGSWAAFADGQWHKVEVYGKYNTNSLANGICKIWTDGVLKSDKTNYTWRTGVYANDIFKRFYLPSNAGDGVHLSAPGDIIYIDDVQIWDGMPSSTTPPPPTCTESWSCTPWSAWSTCTNNFQSQTRTCTDANSCGTTTSKPITTQTQACTSSQTVSTKLAINDRVKTTTTLNVRATPSGTGTYLGTQPIGSFGKVIGGPTYDGTNWWWQVDYDNAPDGWSAEQYLERYTVATCIEAWRLTNASAWSTCVNNSQTRTLTYVDDNSCGTIDTKPITTETQSCTQVTTYSLTNFTQLVSDWLKTISSPADVNSDGKVDSRDLGIMMSNWKQ